MPWLTALLLTNAAATVAAGLTSQDHITIPLVQRQTGNADATAQTLHAVNSHSRRSSNFAIAPETFDPSWGYWYGTFSIGASNNLSILIDTGSSELAVDPGLYDPSPHSQNLHHSGTLQYATAGPKGCQSADIKYHTFADTVSFGGLTARNQTFAKVIESPDAAPGVITQFSHNGLVGFAWSKPDETLFGETPFFQRLCDQGAVKQCRFGIAYGTKGIGKQILGGVDSNLYDGNLAFSPILNGIYSGAITDGSVVYKGKSGSGTLKKQTFLFDTGTTNVVGPSLSVVRGLFKALGIQAVTTSSTGCAEVLLGYYACDSPAKVGFTVGKQTFYIEPSAFKVADNGNNNCTTTITVVGNQTEPLWILGQSWFQGKYVDFQQPHKIGVAELRDKTLAA